MTFRFFPLVGRSTLLVRHVATVYIILLAIYFLLISLGFGPYITDDHPFRQTQTAITARYLDSFSDIFNYETPVLGPPWTIPFELPLYQAISKLLSNTSGLNLELAARLVSVLFFLLCFWPIARIIDQLRVKHKVVVVSLVLLTPLYVFWSRSFMIETTALFFTLLYLSEFYRLSSMSDLRTWDLLALFLAGTIAGLVKVTTFLPIFIVACTYLVFHFYKWYGTRQEVTRVVLLSVVQVAIFLALIAWVRHTDAIKSMSPIGTMLTSESLRSWNFGTLVQRFDPYIWFRLGNNVADIYFPLPRRLALFKGLGCIFLTGTFIYFFSLCNKVRRLQVSFFLFLFVLPMLIFFNLHRVHNYYQNANAVFLSMSLGISMVGALEATAGLRRVIIKALYSIIILLFVASSMYYFSFKSSYSYQNESLAKYLQEQTTEESILIITGMDWSPEIPYYAKRRALMLTDSFPIDIMEMGLKKTIDSGEVIGAFVRCGPSDLGGIEEHYISIPKVPSSMIANCEIFLFGNR